MIPDTGTDMLHLTPALDMLYLTHDIWQRYLTCYTWYLILDTWYLTSVLDMSSLNTWYLTPVNLVYNIWWLTCYHSLNMLSHGTSTLDLILWHLTGYYCTWRLYYFAYSWLSLLRGLAWLLYYYQIFGTPELLCSWTPVFLNPYNRETPDILLLLIPVIG